jgi:hypothetical protein
MYTRLSREKHLEKRREKCRQDQRKIRKNLKREMVNAYGGQCACCGESHIEFLTLDHVNGDGAEERLRLGFRQGNKNKDGGIGSAFYLHLKKLGWPNNGYQVLCYNCNCAKRASACCPHERKRKEQMAS